MPEDQDTQQFLADLKARRDEARKNFSRWSITVTDLLRAYKAGERQFDRATLDGANLDGANLSRANLSRANLSRANLSRATLDGATLDGATLDGATLDGATLDGATLDGANLSRANLDGATLYGATLDGANLSRANLSRATLDGATLDGATLDGATLDGANLSRATLPEGWHVLQIGPVGSRNDYTVAIVQPDGERIVRTGCFSGSLDEFVAAVARKREGDEHRADYESMVIPTLRHFFAKYPAAAVEEAPVAEEVQE